MPSPTIDIIVTVWNHPFETRACLSSVLTHSPGARLIVVDNASSRETELMLEEFSEPLGERALFITSQRNLGLVPAINLGLSRSDSDYAVILRPQVRVHAGWLTGLLEAAQGGIASPRFRGTGAPQSPPVRRGSSVIETFGISFSALVLKGDMHRLLGGFDEQLDGGEWCLRDYVRRAWSKGYRTSLYSGTTLDYAVETVYGSRERLLERTRSSSDCYRQRWGTACHYAIYFGQAPGADSLAGMIETILEGARQGHRFTLFLHRRQYAEFRRKGWSHLHTAVELQPLPLFSPQRALHKRMAELLDLDQGIIAVRAMDRDSFPDSAPAITFDEMAAAVAGMARCGGEISDQADAGDGRNGF
ncbi:glycosyl transferase [Geobacter sp. SVR]|nr:glycosyl transferase [Geobacter sp. SVR]GCF84915.1 glycosyl transferase [Geobacter sp. SVR]